MIDLYMKVLSKASAITDDTQVLGVPFDTLINDLYLDTKGAVVAKRIVFQEPLGVICFTIMDDIVVGSINDQRLFVEYGPVSDDVEKWKERLRRLALQRGKDIERFWLIL